MRPSLAAAPAAPSRARTSVYDGLFRRHYHDGKTKQEEKSPLRIHLGRPSGGGGTGLLPHFGAVPAAKAFFRVNARPRCRGKRENIAYAACGARTNPFGRRDVSVSKSRLDHYRAADVPRLRFTGVGDASVVCVCVCRNDRGGFFFPASHVRHNHCGTDEEDPTSFFSVLHARAPHASDSARQSRVFSTYKRSRATRITTSLRVNVVMCVCVCVSIRPVQGD